MRSICIALMLVVLTGCVGDDTWREVESLRKGGDAQQAVELAKQLLNEQPTRMRIWPEFCLATTSLVRPLENTGKDPLPLLLQSALVCAAITLDSKQNPPAEWRDALRFMGVELSRQANVMVSEMNDDIQSADYRTTLSELPGQSDGRTGAALLNALIVVEEARRGARSKLERMTLVAAALTALPAGSPGAQAVMDQLDEVRPEWAGALELKPDFMLPITQSVQDRWASALDKAVGDLRELDYFLPGTIFENGVY